MNKPLFFVKGLVPYIPVVSHSRNINMIKWTDRIEYDIPLYGELLKGKPIIKVDKYNLTITYLLDGYKSDTIE